MTLNPSASDSYNHSFNTIVFVGGCILALSFGVRSVFGGIVEPLSQDLFGGKIEIFSLSIAIQNLVWGIAQPAFGAIADRFGDRRALWLGFACYLLGLVVCITGTSPTAQHLGAGVLVGMGISGTAFGVVLAVIGRVAPTHKRGLYLGIASALGSVGQAVMPLLASWLTQWLEWQAILSSMALLLLLMVICIPFLRVGHHSSNNLEKPRIDEGSVSSLSDTVIAAFKHPSFVFLTAGFFVCGFHLAFITAHLPNYVQHFCMGTNLSPEELRALGLKALSIVGFANILGTLLASYLGAIFPKPYVLSAIYALRTVVILAFISQPVTPQSVMIFAMAMGGLWLSTVPLTSSLVLTMFGSKTVGTLFGFVFLGHQLGSFAGVWLAGVWFDRYESYTFIWHASVILGITSAVIHLVVKEQPVEISEPEENLYFEGEKHQ